MSRSESRQRSAERGSQTSRLFLRDLEIRGGFARRGRAGVRGGANRRAVRFDEIAGDSEALGGLAV